MMWNIILKEENENVDTYCTCGKPEQRKDNAL